MTMRYVDNWEKTQERFAAWWEGETLDRALIQITAPKKDVIQSHKFNEWFMVHNLNDIDLIADEYRKYCEQTFFGGEAFPNFFVNFGPGVMSSYIGAIPRIAEDTVWFETPKEWDTIDKEVYFNEDSEWWKTTMRLTTGLVERSNGDFHVSMTDLGGNFDILASLRGTETLLFDLVENSEKISEILNRIDQLWIKYFTILNNIIHTKLSGTSSWLSMWSPKNWYPLQCDFSAMISPKHFEEFVRPSLVTASEFLDHTIYHLDGPGELPHVDILLDIPTLGGIQWVPGDVYINSGSEKWFPLYKKIQTKGKLLQLPTMNPKLIENLLSEISPKGLMIHTQCKTQEEAEYILKNLEKWSLKKNQIFT